MSDHRKEPDLVVTEPPEGFKALHPAIKGNGQAPTRAPMIAWGTEYRAWPDRRKIIYLEKLASSMNHAADVMQRERNRATEVAAHLEKQLKASRAQELKLAEVFNKRFADFNEGRQSLLKRCQELESIVAAQAKELKGGALD